MNVQTGVVILSLLIFSISSKGAAFNEEDGDQTYTKISLQWCPNAYGLYKTVEEAKSACSSDSQCRGIYDWKCGQNEPKVIGPPDFQLCPLESVYKKTRASCIYHKDTLETTKNATIIDTPGEAYTNGPSVKNSAAYGPCSGTHGTLEWATEQCDNEMSCKWLHDWGCDDNSWRFCSKGDISDHKGKGGCSKIKPVKEGNECRTTEGSKCVFPFKFHGTVYEKCTEIDNDFPWCSTEVDENGNHVEGQWGNCDSECLGFGEGTDMGKCEEYGGLVNPLQPTKCCSKDCKGYCSDLGSLEILKDGPGKCYKSPDLPPSDCCGSFIPTSKVCGVGNQMAPCTRGVLKYECNTNDIWYALDHKAPQYCLCEPGYKLAQFNSMWRKLRSDERRPISDRVYDMKCEKLGPEYDVSIGSENYPNKNPKPTKNTEDFSICSDGIFQNDFEYCNSSFMIGMESLLLNTNWYKYKDRWFYFSFQPFDTHKWEMKDCETTEFSKLNYQKNQKLTLKQNQVIKGIKSEYDANKLDRIFSFNVCNLVKITKVATCQDQEQCSGISQDTCKKFEGLRKDCPTVCGLPECLKDLPTCETITLTSEKCKLESIKKDCPKGCMVESFFLGNTGEEDCNGGSVIKDETICRFACTTLGIPIKEMINGLICYKDNAGNCYQNGRNGGGASMVCEKTHAKN